MENESKVYFVRTVKSGMIKIGVSKDTAKRFASLQTGCPEELELILEMPGDSTTEHRLHRRFEEYRVRGEWFNLIGKLWTYVVDQRIRLQRGGTETWWEWYAKNINKESRQLLQEMKVFFAQQEAAERACH